MSAKPIKTKWNSEAVKAYETGQGVELVNETYPHYVPKNPIKGTKMYKPRLDQGVDYERGEVGQLIIWRAQEK